LQDDNGKTTTLGDNRQELQLQFVVLHARAANWGGSKCTSQLIVERLQLFVPRAFVSFFGIRDLNLVLQSWSTFQLLLSIKQIRFNQIDFEIMCMKMSGKQPQLKRTTVTIAFASRVSKKTV